MTLGDLLEEDSSLAKVSQLGWLETLIKGYLWNSLNSG